MAVRTNNGIMVKSVELIVAYPGLRHPRTGELRNPTSDHRQNILCPRILHEVEIIHVDRCL